MLSSRNFWFGVFAGVAVPWLYGRYMARRSTGA